MREYLFRGQREDTGEWVYGDLVHDIPGNPMINVIDGLYEGDDFLIRPETLGEYTGLKDSAGKMIFEGDIVKSRKKELFKMEEDELTGEIKFSRGVFGIEWHGLYMPELRTMDDGIYKYIEIIGNKFDNPELVSRE